ncbi:E3 ubiquitin-protein ligase RNF128 [Drosophila rhopaloa]|uniref:E3 ubiquitin-protein ligase RNF128 n=1 Tax=Drosophila rhopaloa TaxID=1041015 RepID=A0A6P4EBE3_DRORH|nr:E3 ubiquitin-protein ligase RNF128 [Drosophila rhopaloa]
MSYNNVVCTICSERYRTADNIHAGTCGHAFHEECLSRWRKQSKTCPICRCENAAYFQLYLDFEESSQGGSARGGVGTSGRNQSQGHSDSSSSSNSNSSSNNSTVSSTSDYGIMREYENLLYETGVYQEEIEYLNERIGALTLRNSRLCKLRGESDSEYD